jgi:hypothetical protein
MPLRHLIALIINAHPSSVSRRNPRRIPPTRYATVDGRIRTFVRTDRALIRKTFLCFKIDPTTRRSSFADMNMHNLRRWMKGGRRIMSLGARKRFTACRRVTFARNDLLFTMSDNTRMQTARGRDALHARISFHGRAQEGGIGSAGRYRWWSQTESNRRPPACKAGALPTELWPRTAAPAKREWWAWEDLNFRPHAYQARALTN